ncbi:hypothetical protein CcrJ4_gp111 [Caulobacter phage J4]|nr:hypothetical protein CcrJ4_gp111 [Caulobacter phage J4]
MVIHSDRNLYVRTGGGDATPADFYWLKDAYLTLASDEGMEISVLVAADQDSGGVVRFTQAGVAG